MRWGGRSPALGVERDFRLALIDWTRVWFDSALQAIRDLGGRARHDLGVCDGAEGFKRRPGGAGGRSGWLGFGGQGPTLQANDVLADSDAIADALLRLCSAGAEPLHHPAAPDGPPPQPPAREEL